MQLGGAGLEGLGAAADKDTYLSRVQSLKDEIDSGLREVNPTNVDSRLISENEELLFEAVDAPLQEDEVARLRTASSVPGFSNTLDGLMEAEEEDDAELEMALLEMFAEQGDIDRADLPKTGKV